MRNNKIFENKIENDSKDETVTTSQIDNNRNSNSNRNEYVCSMCANIAALEEVNRMLDTSNNSKYILL